MSGNPATPSGGSTAGGGGVGGGGGIGGSGAGGSSCDIEFDTVLGSPEPDEVSALRVGDVLSVALVDQPPSVIVTNAAGARVGGILQAASELRACMQGGYRYGARVLSINGGAVRVRIASY